MVATGRHWFIGIALTIASLQPARAREPAPLELEAKIPLGEVKGRIDHLAFDPRRRHLIVAELGNNSVAVVDLAARKVVHRIQGLGEPQGVAYVGSTDTIYVADARDGSVQLFRAADYAAAGRIDLGSDADNIRLDAGANRVYVGYGSGALAVIDPASGKKIAEIGLEAHPESFQLDPASQKIFVNVPDAGEIAVVDRASGRQTAAWRSGSARANFPMALDRQHVLVAFRKPARLMAFDKRDGAIAADVELCGDADDVFLDAKRRRVYVSCGKGEVDVFDGSGPGYRRIARTRTASGARTSLFIPELDRLFVAVPASGNEQAAIWVFRPA